MNYERFELGDRLIIYIFGSPDRTETIQILAPIQDFQWMKTSHGRSKGSARKWL